MTTIEILKAGRALISDPARWVQKMLAEKSYGGWCDPTSNDAVRFCSMGALERFARGNDWEAREALIVEMGRDNIATFNDTHTHAEVLAAWDRAIAKAEALP